MPDAPMPPDTEVIRRRVVVDGRVQGVGFRVSCRHAAATAGVAGVVRNLADGRVEAVFEGRRAIVDELVAWCRHGPRHAQVRNVRVHEEPPTGATGFRIG